MELTFNEWCGLPKVQADAGTEEIYERAKAQLIKLTQLDKSFARFNECKTLLKRHGVNKLSELENEPLSLKLFAKRLQLIYFKYHPPQPKTIVREDRYNYFAGKRFA